MHRPAASLPELHGKPGPCWSRAPSHEVTVKWTVLSRWQAWPPQGPEKSLHLWLTQMDGIRIPAIEILPRKVMYLAPNPHSSWDFPNISLGHPIAASPSSMTENNQISQNYTLENHWPPALLKTLGFIKNKESRRHYHSQEESKDVWWRNVVWHSRWHPGTENVH